MIPKVRGTEQTRKEGTRAHQNRRPNEGRLLLLAFKIATYSPNRWYEPRRQVRKKDIEKAQTRQKEAGRENKKENYHSWRCSWVESQRKEEEEDGEKKKKYRSWRCR